MSKAKMIGMGRRRPPESRYERRQKERFRGKKNLKRLGKEEKT